MTGCLGMDDIVTSRTQQVLYDGWLSVNRVAALIMEFRRGPF